ncbi:MAG: tetratricopeptide repeat protein [Lentimicrobium sp.]|nr:tetratricopeptide repeat protein [Lentimicrobium sp.]
MSKRATLLFFLLISNMLLIAGSQDDFDKANKAYMAGFYSNAIAIYEEILVTGRTSPELYYNLGNAYFKNDQLPESILNFERAIKLDPGNEDYLYNLRIANNKLIDKIDTLPELFYITWWNSLKYRLSANHWALLALISFTLVFILITIFLLSRTVLLKRILFYGGILFILVHILAGIMAWQTYAEARNRNSAIVFAPSLPVKSSPDESSIDLFVIHEGLKVQIIDNIGDWNEIRLENGSKGWIKSEKIQRI